MDQIDIESASPVLSKVSRGVGGTRYRHRGLPSSATPVISEVSEVSSSVSGVTSQVSEVLVGFRGIRGAQGTKYRYIQRKYNLSEVTKVS